MPATHPTETHTYEQIICAGVTHTYQWYERARFNRICHQANRRDFTGWKVTFTMLDGEGARVTKAVDHQVVMKALSAIAAPNGKDVSAATQRNARLLLTDPESADFDAAAADEVLQIAILGELTFL